MRIIMFIFIGTVYDVYNNCTKKKRTRNKRQCSPTRWLEEGTLTSVRCMLCCTNEHALYITHQVLYTLLLVFSISRISAYIYVWQLQSDGQDPINVTFRFTDLRYTTKPSPLLELALALVPAPVPAL